MSSNSDNKFSNKSNRSSENSKKRKKTEESEHSTNYTKSEESEHSKKRKKTEESEHSTNCTKTEESEHSTNCTKTEESEHSTSCTKSEESEHSKNCEKNEKITTAAKKYKIITGNNKYEIRINRNSHRYEPNFYNLCYCLKTCTTHNVPTYHVIDIYNCYQECKEESNFYICIIHGVKTSKTKDCLHCTTFPTFNYTFIVQTRFRYYTFVQPSLFIGKNFNYFRSFIYCAALNLKLEKSVNIRTGKKTELKYYENFMSNEFKGGELKLIMGGKKSFIRNKILGFYTNGLRLTLTIDCSLGPNYISIPKKLYEEIDLATPYVIINRAPSINSKCIYIVEMLNNVNENDNTIHISPFFTSGLHADQDGDDLSIFYLKRKGEIPSMTMQAAITELKSLSWKYGRRHDFAYRPRYNFTQYHHYILYVFDDFFKKHNALWKRLGGTSKERCRVIMELGSSILHDEVDEFIQLLIEFTTSLGCVLTTSHDMLDGTGSLKSVVESGAKGSNDHIKIFLDNLYNIDPNYEKNLISGFDRYVDSSMRMSQEGTRQFTLLYGTNSIYIHNNNIYSNNNVILRNVHDSHMMSAIFYNRYAVDYVNSELLNDDSV